ncbi:reverse transcriptase [Gossypium australe]|uniref:Reverse transcriptase n=1 Tax=Gossypium australe TaxID=47621 RepID=A0A5B6VM59_9ROSI|nr:reverse transcriptase [Gossypium australe]
MSCVRSVRYVVKRNIVLSKTIIPERGLRQGEPPLSLSFFFLNKKSDAEVVLNILKNFSKASGQKINFDKSMIRFSSNTPLDQQHFYSDLFGMKVVNQLDNYLGLPLSVGNRKFALQQNRLLAAFF